MSKFRPKRPGKRPVVIGQGRETSLKRGQPTIEPRKVILCASNGQETEIQYLKALRSLDWVSSHSDLKVKFLPGSPLDLVRKAHRLAAQEDFDHIWAVADVDEFDCDVATAEAKDCAIDLFWSNPCFEVWLLLHIEPSTRHVENATKVEAALSQALGKIWVKNDIDFPRFVNGINDAVGRARALRQPPEENPSTSMWVLIEKLRDLRNPAYRCRST